ncbi:RNA polymerase sigma factor SigM [Mycobacterium tuberculosis CAS/NITR204]|uniref:RNA polymerase sigma factor SigM n=1 Tax=Mycobacterium tuberculosis CAS/NITR204 TaxID=1310114 RepID=R4MCJ1_MYCTX|nr:RNA polymerase sigma factor SigM [Mycobacterium tuberculosis CAS/NITR204]
MPPPIGYCPAVGFGGRHERSDAELLAAHVAGDRYAFDQLFRRHHRQLHRSPQPATSEDADDALQDAMLSAHLRRRLVAVRCRRQQLVAPHRGQRLPGPAASGQSPSDRPSRRCLSGRGPDRAGRDRDRGAAGTDAAARRAAGRGGRRGHAGLFDRRHPPGCWAWPRAPSRAAAPGRGPA